MYLCPDQIFGSSLKKLVLISLLDLSSVKQVFNNFYMAGQVKQKSFRHTITLLFSYTFKNNNSIVYICLHNAEKYLCILQIDYGYRQIRVGECIVFTPTSL